MRNIRLFFAAFALMLTTSTFANPGYDTEPRRSSVTYEIQKMLKDSGLIIEEEITVTVIFQLNEEHKIEIKSVRSNNEEVNEFLRERLNNQKLHGAGWFTEKIYELPVKVQARK